MGKLDDKLCRYPADQKFYQNRSISHRFRDKCIFFDFWEKLSRLCKFSGGQKFRFTQKFKMADKNVCVCRGGGGGGGDNFGEKSPLDSPNTLWVKNFVEIALSCTVFQIVEFSFSR